MKKTIYTGLALLWQISIGFSQETLSLSLEEAKDMALQRNPILQMQFDNVNAQQGVYWAEMIPPNPEIGIEIEQIPRGQAYTNYGEKRVFISQSFDFPSNYVYRHKLFKSKIHRQKAELKNFRRELIFRVKEAYYTLSMQQGLVEQAHHNLELSQDFFRRSKRSYELGESDRLTMLKAKVNLGDAQQQLTRSEKDLQTDESILREVLGLRETSASKIVLADSLPETITSVSYAELSARLNDHPALLAARISQNAMLNAKRLASSGFLPSISLTYYKQTIAQEDFKGGGIGLSFPLWFFGQKGRVQFAEAQLSRAGHFENAETLRLQKEFAEAAANLQKAAAEVGLYQTNLLMEAEEVFRIAKESYQVGEIGYLQYIDAQQTLIQTRVGYLQSLRNYQLEKAHLSKLVGVEL